MLEQVIFSIDGSTILHNRYKFLKHADQLRAMGKIINPIVMCVGGYEGELEPSFMCASKDYLKYFTQYTKGQESILYVPGDVRQPCTLRYKNGEVEVKKPMKKINPWAAKNFTYVEATKEWWSCDDPHDNWEKNEIPKTKEKE